MKEDMENKETWDEGIMLLKIGHIKEKWKKHKQMEMQGSDLNVTSKVQKSKNLDSEVGSPDKDKEDQDDEDAEEQSLNNNFQCDRLEE